MSELKFNCPRCGQHLSGDESYAGMEIVCPACGNQVIVPGAAPTRLAAAGGPPPVPGAPSKAVPRPSGKKCGLAIASLVCSIGSFIIIPFGFIPGIICGHMARKKIAATPGLLGAGMAKAGLIIGYISLGLNVLVAMAVAAFFFVFATRVRQAGLPAGSPPSVTRSESGGSAPAESETTDTESDGSGWTMKLAGVEIPSGAVTGRVHGQSFKLEKVTLNHGWLNFAQGKEFFADREVDIVLFESDTSKLSGRTFTMPKEGFGITPQIWLKWKEPGRSVPKQRNFSQHYAMQLEFGQLSGGKLPGKIYLCLPDKEKSFIAGSFEAQVKGSP